MVAADDDCQNRCNLLAGIVSGSVGKPPLGSADSKVGTTCESRQAADTSVVQPCIANRDDFGQLGSRRR